MLMLLGLLKHIRCAVGRAGVRAVAVCGMGYACRFTSSPGKKGLLVRKSRRKRCATALRSAGPLAVGTPKPLARMAKPPSYIGDG